MMLCRRKGANLNTFGLLPEYAKNAQGDTVPIMEGHRHYAKLLLPPLLDKLKVCCQPVVVSLFGGSGCGKTGTAAALALELEALGISSIVIGGDHFPRRIPVYNDAERLSRFRTSGLAALVREGLYSESVQQELELLWDRETDSDPALTEQYQWLKTYQAAGRAALTAYLGTPEEQDYEEVNRVIAAFRQGKPVWLRCMGRTEDSRRYQKVETEGKKVCILEWTHGGSAQIEKVDIPIYLDSTPDGTRQARKLRGRDAGTDSLFTAMVLEIEQAAIRSRVPFASLVLQENEVTVQ